VIDWLLGQGVPLHALGVQAHLAWRNFTRQFNTNAYRSFLAEVAARGLTILITEMDVLDDGLKADIATRDAGVADVYRRYLDVALDEPAYDALSQAFANAPSRLSCGDQAQQPQHVGIAEPGGS
jgi:endo-1,4-beta-xylanase